MPPVRGTVRVGDLTRRIEVAEDETWTSSDLVGSGESPPVSLVIEAGLEQSTNWLASMGTEGVVVFVVTEDRIRVRRHGPGTGETRTA